MTSDPISTLTALPSGSVDSAAARSKKGRFPCVFGPEHCVERRAGAVVLVRRGLPPEESLDPGLESRLGERQRNRDVDEGRSGKVPLDPRHRLLVGREQLLDRRCGRHVHVTELEERDVDARGPSGLDVPSRSREASTPGRCWIRPPSVRRPVPEARPDRPSRRRRAGSAACCGGCPRCRRSDSWPTDWCPK